MGKLIDKLKQHNIEITQEIEKEIMKEFVEKSEVDLKDKQIIDLKQQIKTRDADIEELKKVDSTKLQENLATLQAKYKEDTDKLNNQLKDAVFDGNFAKSIVGKKVKDVDILKSLIDKDKDIPEQIAKIEKEKAFLFEAEENTGAYKYTPAGGKVATDTTDSSNSNFIKIIKENQVKRN